MKAVNLLPEDLRPRRASGGLKGSSYVLVGALAVLLLMAVGYVMTSNSINSKKSDIATAEQEAAAAEARVAQLGAYQQFAQIKATRFESVKELATQRFDWERMMREIALVLPERTSIVELTAATAGAAPAAAGTAAPAPAAADPTAAATSGPSLQVKGCAEDQPDVATLMVRLRRLYQVEDVELTESTELEGADGASTSLPAVSSDSTEGSDGCPGGSYEFDIKVTFSAAPPEDGQKLQVPARLGGGA